MSSFYTTDIFNDFNVQGRKHYEHKPDKCPICLHTEIGSVELLGVKSGTLFWECEGCDSRFLRYTYRKTNGLLKKAQELYYDLEDLDTIHLEPPN